MITNYGVIDVEFKCSICGCTDIDVEFDTENYMIYLTCQECKIEDAIEL